uniref:Uncharacterized protein n=1 Tax=Vibrio parahaemolyticus TaxID=670 RepID=A0A1Y1BA40_VIBPH|nr:hypothetical protein [Vibrio parahaemolyticus]BAX57003.1 hypothetical protein [Vibrio parahaemolyticus]
MLVWQLPTQSPEVNFSKLVKASLLDCTKVARSQMVKLVTTRQYLM